MYKLSLSAFLLCTASLFLPISSFAQCPELITCPSGNQLYCDESPNDPLLWKAPPYTFAPILGISDLPEAGVELSIVVRDTCGDSLIVHYILLLDLNGDDLAETAVLDEASLPAGKILTNNTSSPGHASGDLLEFDSRAVPDTMKYRFALEKTYLGDTLIAKLRWATGADSTAYSLPNLPNGKHRIIWTVQQGGVVDTCAYDFRVKDCLPPIITCVSGLAVYMPPTGFITLWATDFINSLEDNTTPAPLIEIAIRREGSGIGFPLDDNGNPASSVTFTCCELGTQFIELWARDKAGNVSFCTAYVIIQSNFGNCGQCATTIHTCAKTELQEGVEHVQFILEELSAAVPGLQIWGTSGENGCSEFTHSVPVFTGFTLTPTLDDAPLNGVTTYDLVLMSKHILAQEPLNSPYKMIAADANRSGSITTFDIVQLRKLLLGIYDTLPGNNSWRFIRKDFLFPNPLNPFASSFPETAVDSNWLGEPYLDFEFVGVKVGDVNNSAVAHDTFVSASETRTVLFATLPDLSLQAGETADIPLRLAESGTLLGFQLSLHFDPQLLEIEQVMPGHFPGLDENAWAQPQPGVLNLSWSDAAPHRILPEDDLLRLRIRARSPLRTSDIFSLPENPRLQPEAYDATGSRRSLQLIFSGKKSFENETLLLEPQPNPTTAGTDFNLHLRQPQNVWVELSDPAGTLLWNIELSLQAGGQVLEIPAAAFPQAGIYFWKAQVGEVMKSGKIVRL